jgi:hypothetical protein
MIHLVIAAPDVAKNHYALQTSDRMILPTTGTMRMMIGNDMLTMTGARVFDEKSLALVYRAITAGLFGRASKKRYFLWIHDKDGFTRGYLPLFTQGDSGERRGRPPLKYIVEAVTHDSEPEILSALKELYLHWFF